MRTIARPQAQDRTGTPDEVQEAFNRLAAGDPDVEEYLARQLFEAGWEAGWEACQASMTRELAAT
jgi:hypothetical protein